jgi:glycosyltransferase involved in cell wall biosynthesis
VATAPLAAVAVAFVSSHSLEGGSELYLERLLEELGPAWVDGVTCLAEGPLVGRLQARGWPVEVIPASGQAGIPRGVRELRWILRRSPPDVVHANGVKAALCAGLAAIGTGVPVIWVKHDFSWDGPLAGFVARLCAEVVAVSAAVAETFGASLRPRVHVVPNGIPETAVDRVAARDELVGLLRCPPEAPVVGLLGRIHPAKGQLELVEAAPRILEHRPDVRFAIIGEPDRYQPDYAVAVRRRSNDLGLGERLSFVGHRPDGIAALAGCDVVVVPSVRDDRGMGREGFGLVGVEALSVGTPVVGYADGALPEVLGPCAHLVEPGSRRALADVVLRVLGDEGLRRQMTDCGRERVRVHYSLSTMVERMKQRYRVAARSAPGS